MNIQAQIKMKLLVLFHLVLVHVVSASVGSSAADPNSNNNNMTSTFSTASTASTASEMSSTTDGATIEFVGPMRNYTKIDGDPLKLRCEVRADPAVTEFRWFKNEAPFAEERGRVRIKSRLGSGPIQRSQIRFQKVDAHDMGYYKCEASNGIDTVVSAESVVKVFPNNKRKAGTNYWSDHANDAFDDDYEDEDLLVPQHFPLDLDATLGSGSISGLPSHIEFQGRAPDDFGPNARNSGGHHSLPSSSAVNGNVLSLKPNERAGR